MFGLGLPELLVIGAIILLIFGARRLPEIGRGLGKTVKEIKNVSKDLKGGNKEEAAPEEKRHEESEVESSAESSQAKAKGMPGIEEIKTVGKTASEVRKWWRVLKR